MLVLPDWFPSPNMSTEVNLCVLEASVSSCSNHAARASAVLSVRGQECIRCSSSKGREPSRCWTLFSQGLPFHMTDPRPQEVTCSWVFNNVYRIREEAHSNWKKKKKRKYGKEGWYIRLKSKKNKLGPKPVSRKHWHNLKVMSPILLHWFIKFLFYFQLANTQCSIVSGAQDTDSTFPCIRWFSSWQGRSSIPTPSSPHPPPHSCSILEATNIFSHNILSKCHGHLF